MIRKHRRSLQKAIYAEVFHCSKCGDRVRRVHPFLRLNTRFIFSRYSRCIRCGTLAVQRRAKRDRVDSVSKHLLSRLQSVTGAPINKCAACRLQYYDWRRPRPGAMEERV